MDLRTADIARKLADWLDRYASPVHLREKPEAAQAEADALTRVLCKYAPQDDYQPFLNRVFGFLDQTMKTRTWPTVQEIGSACASLRKDEPRQEAEAKLDPYEMTAKRMSDGKEVGEGFLWGRDAVEMIARRLVDEPTMTRYRSAAFFRRKDMYGEIAALEWEAAAKERHQAAKDMRRDKTQHVGGVSFNPSRMNEVLE